MNLEFNQVQVSKPKRNYFDLSHERKFTMDMGYLVPLMCNEVLPGDSFSVVNQQLIRMAPMLAPMMHKVDVYTHYFFVPNRIVWDEWDEFISGNQGEAPAPVMPTVNLSNVHVGTLADYMGLPIGNYFNRPFSVNALPFAGYNKIYNEYYRDQNLIESIPDTLESGDNSSTFAGLISNPPLKRAWEHDYFTSALPWTQKGEEVLLTFDTEATSQVQWNPQGPTDFISAFPAADGVWDSLTLSSNPLGSNSNVLVANEGGHLTSLQVNNANNLEVDLSGSYLMSVNQLRQAVQIQKWLELNARAGSRYIETILAHFGVRSDDARLQRPEYLGGGKSMMNVSEVLQQSESGTTPQGTMAGHGINYGESHEFKAYFKEHGYVIGIISVMPKTNYQQGLPKHFSKRDKFDYFWNTLAHLGEQAIYNEEIYLDQSPQDRKKVFGYIPRYSEYKYQPSTVHGDFAKNLAFWHMGRIFSSPPALNQEFIECSATDRIFAVTGEDTHSLWVHAYLQVKASRPIPVFSTPQL